MRNDIFVETAAVDTKVNAFTPTCNGQENLEDLLDIPNVCDPEGDLESEARASGVFDAGSEALVWDACTFPEEYSEDPQGGGYTPEHQAEGPGCLNGYKSQGNVNCGGSVLCGMGNLEEDDNPQDEEWVQPLEAFTLSADGSSIALERTRIPNGQPSSTYLSFEGERSDVKCE